jgi:6-pyruvoyltetrahydropterin/6-carboxytetrahydropterin synthase
MFTIKKEFKFEAAHKLPQHDGKCHNLHGHSWRGFVEIRGRVLHGNGPKTDMLMDFGDVKKIIGPTVDNLLDHQFLNETLPLPNPTSEAIAEYLFNLWRPLIAEACPLAELAAVVIEETCTSACRYEASR